jgi:hypothetical protein
LAKSWLGSNLHTVQVSIVLGTVLLWLLVLYQVLYLQKPPASLRIEASSVSSNISSYYYYYY